MWSEQSRGPVLVSPFRKPWSFLLLLLRWVSSNLRLFCWILWQDWGLCLGSFEVCKSLKGMTSYHLQVLITFFRYPGPFCHDQFSAASVSQLDFAVCIWQTMFTHRVKAIIWKIVNETKSTHQKLLSHYHKINEITQREGVARDNSKTWISSID